MEPTIDINLEVGDGLELVIQWILVDDNFT